MNDLPKNDLPDWLAQVRFDANGLVPVIAQELLTRRVLMLAYMNRESLHETLRLGEAVYWSRSRQRLWRKGETSGHIQKVREIRLDCDGDTILLKVEQRGGAACHTGRESCFFHRLDAGPADNAFQSVWTVTDPVLVEPEQFDGSKS